MTRRSCHRAQAPATTRDSAVLRSSRPESGEKPYSTGQASRLKRTAETARRSPLQDRLHDAGRRAFRSGEPDSPATHRGAPSGLPRPSRALHAKAPDTTIATHDSRHQLPEPNLMETLHDVHTTPALHTNFSTEVSQSHRHIPKRCDEPTIVDVTKAITRCQRRLRVARPAAYLVLMEPNAGFPGTASGLSALDGEALGTVVHALVNKANVAAKIMAVTRLRFIVFSFAVNCCRSLPSWPSRDASLIPSRTSAWHDAGF